MYDSKQTHDYEFRCMEAIAMLSFHSKQDYHFAIRSYTRVNKVAFHSAIIVFIVMSYFLHAALLGSSVDISTHVIAFILNSIIAIVTFIMVREFHPARANATLYWQSSMRYNKQIKILELEIKKPELVRNNDICQQKRKNSVTTAFTAADRLMHQ